MTSLHSALRLNAISCIGFGVLFVGAAPGVASFLGSPPVPLIRVVGFALLANGLHLVLASLRPRPIWPEVLWFSLGDMVWWLGSLGLLAAGFWITTPAGTRATWAVAIAVAGLGLWQLAAFGRARTGLSGGSHLRRIGRSWMALPLWVMVWLVGLNAVFLVALAFIPSDLARVVLTGYVASGPLLAGFALAQGGLTRISGLGHLIAWVPMQVWLALAAPTGPAGVYAAILAATVAICLALDIFDTARWLRGERAVIGAAAQ